MEQTNIEIEKNIKESVKNYFLSLVKEKYPSLSEKNEKIYSKEIMKLIDKDYEGDTCSSFRKCILSNDNFRCPELVDAFTKMKFDDYSESRMHAAGELLYPQKMRIDMGKNEYAMVYEYSTPRFLYMSDEYKIKIEKRIKDQIDKITKNIPAKIMKNIENKEYDIGSLKLNPLYKNSYLNKNDKSYYYNHIAYYLTKKQKGMNCFDKDYVDIQTIYALQELSTAFDNYNENSNNKDSLKNNDDEKF